MRRKKLENRTTYKDTFKLMYPAICNFIYSYVDDYDISKDLAQDSFLKLYENWDNYSEKQTCKSFLYITSKHIALDYLKHQKVILNHQLETNDIISENFFLHEVTKQETIRLVHLAIDTLPSQTKKVILLSMKGLKNSEIADNLHISINTVKTLKKNAYIKLKSQLSSKAFFVLCSLVNFF